MSGPEVVGLVKDKYGVWQFPLIEVNGKWEARPIELDHVPPAQRAANIVKGCKNFGQFTLDGITVVPLGPVVQNTLLDTVEVKIAAFDSSSQPLFVDDGHFTFHNIPQATPTSTDPVQVLRRCIVDAIKRVNP